MSINENYWKDAYQDKWSDASKRENRLAAYIEERTDHKVAEYGLGAGTDAYISGNAQKNGHEKGDADLRIVDTNIFIEVTGPLVMSVDTSKPLWFRPDKLNNAIRNLKRGHDTFLAHHTPSADLWRIIHIDQEFSNRCFNNEFKVVTPIIRGRQEKYVEILANDPCIKNLEYLIQYLSK